MTASLIFPLLFLSWSSASFAVPRIHLNRHVTDWDVCHYNLSSLLVGHQRMLQDLDTALNFSFQKNPMCGAENCLIAPELVAAIGASSSVCCSCSTMRRAPTFRENWVSCKASGSPERSILFEDNVCNLHFYADPTLWRHFKYERFGVITDRKTSEEINKFFAGHVSALKRIFHETEFTTYDGREMWRGIDFAMDRSTIMTDTTEECNTSQPDMFCLPDLSLDEFNFITSSINHDEYCLAIFFTYRDFDGLVGQTRLPSLFLPGGGICDRSVRYTLKAGTYYMSSNVVWVTLVDKRETLTEKTSHLVLAHVVGNALGSPNDGPDCVPDTDNSAGNYLMYKDLSGVNNSEKFSICSKDNITRFLSNVIYSRHERHNCLKPSISGGGLLHRFDRPEICSKIIDDPVVSNYGRKPDDEL